MSELKAYRFVLATESSNLGGVVYTSKYVYAQDDVDKLLAKKDKEIAKLKDKCQMHDFFWEGCGFDKLGFKNSIAVREAFDRLEAENAELKQKLEDVQASAYAESAYAESVDAGMRERKLKRALWLARAERAKAIQWHEGLDRYLQERKKYWPSRFCFMANDEMYHVWYKCWCEVERKCLAKADEYK